MPSFFFSKTNTIERWWCVARPRSPNRDKAFQLWENSGRKRKLKDIAEKLGVSEEQVRKWKNQDKWDKVTLPKTKSNVTNHKGGQPGNQNALGNRGGAAPPGNKNAVTHGAYETIYLNALPEEERAIFNAIPDSDELNGEIRLLRLKLSRLIARNEITTFDMFGGAHTRELTEGEREKGILEVTAEIRKLIKTKKQIQIAELKANLDGGGEEVADDGFLDALNGTAAEDWADEEG